MCACIFLDLFEYNSRISLEEYSIFKYDPDYYPLYLKDIEGVVFLKLLEIHRVRQMMIG
jgi:hypothetical protein